jgi:hypothetical protein
VDRLHANPASCALQSAPKLIALVVNGGFTGPVCNPTPISVASDN